MALIIINYFNLIIIFVALIQCSNADFEHLVNQPDIRRLPVNYETTLECEMNIQPDEFQWKFYPSDNPYNSENQISLSNASFHRVPKQKFTITKRRSTLTIQKLTLEEAGDYQCLAYYGASVVASVPWRISIAKMDSLVYQKSVNATVQVGNIVSWRCNAPKSNPPAFIEYRRHEKYISPVGKSMILVDVKTSDSSTYRCITTNTFEKKEMDAFLHLNVIPNAAYKAPYFITNPIEQYIAVKGSTLFLECSSVGRPIPKTTWYKEHQQSQIVSSERINILPGGLLIKDIIRQDEGIYICNNTNDYGAISQQIIVKYNEPPIINECTKNKTTKINEGEYMEIECEINGVPEPRLAWFLNGYSVLNDSEIQVLHNRIRFKRVEKRHAGNLQIFASNIVETVYRALSLRVIPKSSNGPTQRPGTTRKPKNTSDVFPPSKPTIARVNDETVVVRWNVTDRGVPIEFYKVQYKELSNQKNDWITTDTIIPARITSYEISGLKTNQYYRFRVAAGYTNSQTKTGQKSNKFHLQSLDFDTRNPLPVCLITHVETLNHTAIKVYWECPEYNVTFDGFYINYNLATTAGDNYMINTVEGGDVRDYVINYLQPDTSYDIKLQSFNQTLASDYSPLMKGRTDALPVTVAPSVLHPAVEGGGNNQKPIENNASSSNIYIIIAGGIIGCAVVVIGIILLFVCRKWQKKKLSDSQDKTNVEHHIQADANEYVVEPKTIQRANGCGNRITITSNPLAEADKNPTVIELRNLANNNVRHDNNLVDNNDENHHHHHHHHQNVTVAKKDKFRHRKNLRGSKENCSTTNTGSNYV